MSGSSGVGVWAFIWLVAALFVLLRHWRRGNGVGLLLAYIVGFGALHWLASALTMLPWSGHRYPEIVADGMRLSAIGMLAFAAGVEIAHAVLDRRQEPPDLPDDATESGDVLAHPGLVTAYLAAGLLLQIVLLPLAHGLATVTALAATGSAFVVAAIGLKCWNARLQDRKSTMWFWLGASAMLPFFTVATQGFLGYGLAAMMSVYAFAAAFYGPRLKVLAAAVLLAYLGLSVYVTYMRDRSDIRALVWTGSTLGERADRVAATVADMEWFDVREEDHLARIDVRLNQNFLVGASVLHVGAGRVPFAGGSTLYDAVLSVVPRAIWPDKPMTAGSGDLVSTYTGIRFGEDTSVGIGQVMEWYVNFGTRGVAAGFLLFGMLIFLFDQFALAALRRGDVPGFAMWFLPGLSLVNIGGSFIEMTATAGAAVAMAWMLSVAAAHFQTRPAQGVEAAGSPP